MMKGSKAWYEVYEKSIYAIEREILTDNQQYVEGEFAKRMRGDFDTHFFGTKGGAFSPSRINIVIGWIILFVWCGCLFFSLYNLNNRVQLSELALDRRTILIEIGLVIVVALIVPLLIKPFIKSSPLLRKKDRGYVLDFCMNLLDNSVKRWVLFGVIVILMSLFYSTLGFILLFVFAISLLYSWIVPRYDKFVEEE